MSAHIPHLGSWRTDLEHALEFCEVMDSLSRDRIAFYLQQEYRELEYCLSVVPGDPDFIALRVLHEMALDLLEEYRYKD